MQAANRPALVTRAHSAFFINNNSAVDYFHQFNLAVTLNTFPAQAGTAALFQFYRIRKLHVKAVYTMNVAQQTNTLTGNWKPVCYSYPVYDGNYPTMQLDNYLENTQMRFHGNSNFQISYIPYV